MSDTTETRTGERELAARFLSSRDEAAFRALYRAHTPALLLLAQRLLGHRQADAEDAVQETWIRAVRVLEDFRWESSLRTWLCGIVVNCCREMIRRRSKEISDPLERRGEFSGAPPPPAEVEALVRALPDGYREVIVLHDLEGYTHEEIGRILEISPGTSKSQLSRARRVLRTWLGAPAVGVSQEAP